MEPIRFRRPFDLIFCRNVMIYFDQPTKVDLVRRFTTQPYRAVIFLSGTQKALTRQNALTIT